jgi:hypothetical protein
MLMMVPPTSAPWLFINFRKRCMLREFARLPDFLIRGQSPDAASFPVYKRDKAESQSLCCAACAAILVSRIRSRTNKHKCRPASAPTTVEVRPKFADEFLAYLRTGIGVSHSLSHREDILMRRGNESGLFGRAPRRLR